jgi:thiamine-phosphate pyrophosphorylase
MTSEAGVTGEDGMTGEDGESRSGDDRRSAPGVAAGGDDRAARLAACALCVLVDGGADVATFAKLVERLVLAGVPMLQLRDKRLPRADVAGRARLALEIARGLEPTRPPLIMVNDCVDIAVKVGADGAHVGAADRPTSEARQRLGPRGLLGRTAHTLDEARQAVTDGADYLGIGPCFPSSTKTFERFAPEAFLCDVSATIPLPAFAIGGITLERIDALAALGIRRVAVASAVTAAPDPAAAAAALLDRLAALRTGR